MTFLEDAHFDHDVSMKPHQLAERVPFVSKYSHRIYENLTNHFYGGWGVRTLGPLPQPATPLSTADGSLYTARFHIYGNQSNVS